MEEQNLTKRLVVAALEDLLFEAIPVLDHGFIRAVDYMGSDGAIVQAARVSYGRGTRSLNDDEALIRYLVRMRHSTPLEMAEIKLHVKLPIFVARQWMRHRTSVYNELSARYSILDREFYVPDFENICAQSKSNKQGRGPALEEERSNKVIAILKRDAVQCHEHYNEMIEDGVARELARTNLTINTYTQFYWKINLHNLLHFLSLRAEGHAQYEIRAYAEVIMNIVKAWVPIAYQAFLDYRFNAVTLSAEMLRIVRLLVKGERVERLLLKPEDRQRSRPMK